MSTRPAMHVYMKARARVDCAVEIGRRQIDLICDGHSDATVLAETRRIYPGRATEKTVRWHRHKVNVVRRWNGQPILPCRGITG